MIVSLLHLCIIRCDDILTFDVASLAFATAGTMPFINAVETKFFRGDDLSSFIDILNSVP